MDKQPTVYIVTNRRNGTLYTGVTSHLMQRIYEHKQKIFKGFTSQYECAVLVFFEKHETMEMAIMREKKIKGGSRKKKLKLIEDMNPTWRDLWAEIIL